MQDQRIVLHVDIDAFFCQVIGHTLGLHMVLMSLPGADRVCRPHHYINTTKGAFRWKNANTGRSSVELLQVTLFSVKQWLLVILTGVQYADRYAVRSSTASGHHCRELPCQGCRCGQTHVTRRGMPIQPQLLVPCLFGCLDLIVVQPRLDLSCPA